MDLYISHLERQNEAKRLALPEPRLTSAEYREAHAKGVAEGRAIVDSWRRQPSTQGFVFSDLNAQDTHHARQTAFRIYTRYDRVRWRLQRYAERGGQMTREAIGNRAVSLQVVYETAVVAFHFARLYLGDDIFGSGEN